MTNCPNHGLFHSNQFLVVLRPKRSQVKRSLLAMGSHEFPVKSAKSNLQKTKGFGTDTVNQFGGYSEKASTNTFLPTKLSHVHLRRNKRPSKKIQLGSSFAKVFRKESCPKSATVGHRFHRFPVGQKKWKEGCLEECVYIIIVSCQFSLWNNYLIPFWTQPDVSANLSDTILLAPKGSLINQRSQIGKCSITEHRLSPWRSGHARSTCERVSWVHSIHNKLMEWHHDRKPTPLEKKMVLPTKQKTRSK